LIKDTKAAHLARGHVRDIIEGWGPRPALPFSLWESETAKAFEKAKNAGVLEEQETGAERERRLRKLAQRGVVRLFNAISAAQGVQEKPEEKKRPREEDGQEGEQQPAAKVLKKPNVLGGRGKAETRSFMPFLSSEMRLTTGRSEQFVESFLPGLDQSRNDFCTTPS
jgi:hypothetical protein